MNQTTHYIAESRDVIKRGNVMNKATYYKWANLPQTPMTPQIKRRLVSGEKMMIVEVTFEKGAVAPIHQHPHEQMSNLLSGVLEFEIAGEKRIVSSGEVVHIPSNLPHKAVALEDAIVLDIFSPPREDFLTDEQ
jgi:quercetin dioxygenase-like cupin family protein